MKVTLEPTKAQIEAGAIAIMNERLRQKGVAPLSNLDVLYPQVLLEVMADSEAALRTIEVPGWQPTSTALKAWALFGKLSDAEASELLSFVISRAAFRDDTWDERACEHCANPYRGPSVYCCHACATADAT